MRPVYYFISLFIFAFQAHGSNTSWQNADLQYTQYINGKPYTAEVTLLRPTTYFTQNNVTKSGDSLVVNLPEMGLDNVAMNVINISPYNGVMIKDVTNSNDQYKQIDEINWDNKKYSPVTATFKRYAELVNTYTFINDKTKQLSKINSTPNHPFYVVNKQQYLAIEKITPSDKLLSDNGDLVSLDCPNYSHSHSCGVRYNVDNKPTLVYNFEVYKKHRYYVTNKNIQFVAPSILVHNQGCGAFNQTGVLDYDILNNNIKKMNSSKGCIFNCFKTSVKVANYLQTGDTKYLVKKYIDIPITDAIRGNQFDRYISQFREQYGISQVEMIADIKPADLMNTLQQYGPGSHAIVRSRSPVNNYYNLDHVFNIVHTSSGYNIGIDAYHPIFFNEALSHLPNYIRDNYHPDVTFDSIIFLPKNFW